MMKGSISTAMTRMRPRNAGTAPAGNWLSAFTVTSDAVDLDGPGRRPALAQHLVDEHREHGAEAASDHPAPAAEDRSAADDDGGDHDQFGAEAELRRHALVLGNRHEAGQRRAQRRQEIGADAHPARWNAGIDRRLLVAAGGECLIAPARLGQHERADDGDDKENHDLIVEAEGIGLARYGRTRRSPRPWPDRRCSCRP